MNKPDIIKVDPYPALSSVVMGVDPFPDNPTGQLYKIMTPFF